MTGGVNCLCVRVSCVINVWSTNEQTLGSPSPWQSKNHSCKPANFFRQLKPLGKPNLLEVMWRGRKGAWRRGGEGINAAKALSNYYYHQCQTLAQSTLSAHFGDDIHLTKHLSPKIFYTILYTYTKYTRYKSTYYNNIGTLHYVFAPLDIPK